MPDQPTLHAMLEPTLRTRTPLLMCGTSVAVVILDEGTDDAETELAAQVWAAMQRGVLVLA